MNVDLPGRTAVVTGASSGLGEETAAVLAAAGARVILAVRNPDRGAASARRITERAPGAELVVEQVDLSALASVRAFTERLRSGTIDILVNNAGAVASPERTFTADGFESHLGVNHIAHFVLTHGLVPALLRSTHARVVSLSSVMHRSTGAIDLGLAETRPYRASNAYAQSKLACGLFGLELDRRAKAAGLHLTSVVAHPGWSNTSLFPTDGAVPFFSRFFGRIGGTLASSPATGALSQIRAATDLSLMGGEFIGPRFLAWGRPSLEIPGPNMNDVRSAMRLWDVSEERTGVSWDDVWA